jgi:hypothetical protein
MCPEYIILELDPETGSTKEIIRKKIGHIEGPEAPRSEALERSYLRDQSDLWSHGAGGPSRSGPQINLCKDYIKGGSKGCLYKNHLYFTVHKSTSFGPFNNLHYINYLIKVDPVYPFDIVGISEPFILTDDAVIFGDVDMILFMIINFGIRHIDFVSDMDIMGDGQVEFIYGYNDEISLSMKIGITNFFSL